MHRGHDHHDHVHAPGAPSGPPPAAAAPRDQAAPPFQPDPPAWSLLAASLGQRLLIAGTLAALLWGSILLVLL